MIYAYQPLILKLSDSQNYSQHLALCLVTIVNAQFIEKHIFYHLSCIVDEFIIWEHLIICLSHQLYKIGDLNLQVTGGENGNSKRLWNAPKDTHWQISIQAGFQPRFSETHAFPQSNSALLVAPRRRQVSLLFSRRCSLICTYLGKSCFPEMVSSKIKIRSLLLGIY